MTQKKVARKKTSVKSKFYSAGSLWGRLVQNKKWPAAPIQHPWRRIQLSYIAKMALVCMLTVTIPFVLVMLLTGSRLSRYLEKSVQQRADQTASYLNTSMDRYFSEIRELTIMPLYDSELLGVLLHHADAQETVYLTFEEQSKVSGILAGPPYETDTVRRIDLYLEDGYRLNEGSNVLKWDDSEREWMSVCDSNAYRTFILPWKGSLAMMRALQEPLTGRQLGYIKVELTENAINDIVKDVQLPEGSQIFIFNDLGQCIYPSDLAGQREDMLPDPGAGDYLSGFMTSSSTSLRVMARVSMSSVEGDIRELLSFAIGVMILALILSWVFALIASLRLTKPIINLKNKMALVGEGRFNTRMTVRSRDEIGQLESMFNSMTESVETLINEVYEESLASKEAQISALQSQINPHFLYNTLETINMMAVSCENYDISEAVSNLGEMMHYCVSNEQHFAPLSDEIRFVNAYYDIQRLRFEDLHSLEVEAGEDCRSLLVPKLLLQPFVENIVQHGMGSGMGGLDILLAAHREGQDLVLIIQNTGRALSSEEQRLVHEKLSAAEQLPANTPWNTTGKGYGLSNVHRRLRLIYGSRCGVSLDDSYTTGARFILRLTPQPE